MHLALPSLLALPRFINYFESNSVSTAPTLALLIVFGIRFLCVIGYCSWEQFPGCKGEPSLSPLAHRIPPPFKDYTHTLEIAQTLLDPFRVNFAILCAHTHTHTHTHPELHWKIVGELFA